MSEQDVERIAAGYDAVYEAIPRSPTFARLWREHAMGNDFPEGFEHISFLTLAEMQSIATALQLDASSTVVDLACGMGGPGLWLARESGAKLIGVDVSSVALDHAARRAETLGLAEHARFVRASFADTGLDAASADAVFSADALQYAPDKRGLFDEIARVLKPGGRLAFVAFELEPERIANVPVLGTDPVSDYRPLIERAGFDVTRYEETPGWWARVSAAYQAIIDEAPALTQDMGEGAYALSGEVALTLQLQPYRGRMLVTATRH